MIVVVVVVVAVVVAAAAAAAAASSLLLGPRLHLPLAWPFYALFPPARSLDPVQSTGSALEITHPLGFLF